MRGTAAAPHSKGVPTALGGNPDVVALIASCFDQGDYELAASIIGAGASLALTPPDFAKLMSAAMNEHARELVARGLIGAVRDRALNLREVENAVAVAQALQRRDVDEAVAAAVHSDAAASVTIECFAQLVHVNLRAQRSLTAIQPTIRDYFARRAGEKSDIANALHRLLIDLGDREARLIFDTALDALLHAAAAQGAIAKVLRVGMARRFVNFDEALAVFSSNGEIVPNDLVELLAELAASNPAAAEGEFAERRDSVAAASDADPLLDLVERSAKWSGENWTTLVDAFIAVAPSTERQYASRFLHAVERRHRVSNDVDKIAAGLCAFLAKYNDDIKVLAQFHLLARNWGLWRSIEIRDHLDGAIGGLPTAKQQFLSSILMFALEEREAARRQIESLSKHDRIKFKPLAENLVAETTIVRIARKNTNEGKWLVERKSPPIGEDVLLICQRNADPATIMSLADRNYNLTLCSMDSWQGRHSDAADQYWSLRDLFLDADPSSRKLTYAIREISELAVAHYLHQEAMVLGTQANSYYAEALSIALEDSMEGAVTIAACMLRAAQKYDGRHVVLAVNDAPSFLNFARNFLETENEIYVTFSGNAPHRALAELEAWAKGSDEQPLSAHDEEPEVVRTLTQLINAKQDISFGELVGNIPRTDETGVLVMGAFGDPIYVDNMIPLIEELLKTRHVYVLEHFGIEPCIKILREAFGQDLKSTPSDKRLILIDASSAVSQAMIKLRGFDAVFNSIAADACDKLSQEALTVDGLALDAFLSRNLAHYLRKAILRYEACVILYEEIFNAIRFDPLYACSERLPARLTAVRAARKHNIRTIDVMAVNSVRLPRYRIPHSDILTSIDTCTTQYFTEYYGLPESRAVLTGSPRMDQVIENIRSSDVDETRRRLGVGADCKIALYACQLQPIDNCIDILERLISVLRRNENSLLVVKLHRRENLAREKSYFECVRQSGVADRIVIIRDEPYLSDIARLIAVSDVVVSMYSNALREAACVGVPFIAADYFPQPIPFDYTEQGIGLRADTAEELVQYTEEMLRHGADAAYRYREARFFERNPQLLNGESAALIARLANHD